MKKLFLLLFLSATWLSCNSGNDPVDKDGFRITGKVKFPDQGWVVLQKMENAGPKGLDSVKLGKDNSFELKGKATEQGFYRLSLFNKQSVIMVLDKGEQVEVTADGNSEKGAFAVKGSKGTEELQRINRLKEGFEAKVTQLNQEYTTAVQSKDEAKQRQIQDQFLTMQKENITAVKKLIDQMGTSLVSLYATNFLKPRRRPGLPEQPGPAIREGRRQKYFRQRIYQPGKVAGAEDGADSQDWQTRSGYYTQ